MRVASRQLGDIVVLVDVRLKAVGALGASVWEAIAWEPIFVVAVRATERLDLRDGGRAVREPRAVIPVRSNGLRQTTAW